MINITRHVIAAFGLFVALTASAYDFKADGICYNILSPNFTCEVTAGDSPYVGNVSIPATVTHNGREYAVVSIADNAFFDDAGLTGVTVSDSVRSIGERAFAFCTSLGSVTLPDSLKVIKRYAFMNNESLASIDLPDAVTEVGAGVFQGCSSLQNVTLPDSLSALGDNMFAYCTSLTHFVFPPRVTNVNYRLFEGCTALRSVTISDCADHINPLAFYGCSSLVSITLPSTLKEIWERVFQGCSSLAAVYSLSEEPPVVGAADWVDADTYTRATLYVPQGSLDRYKAAEYWKNFADIREIDPTCIAEMAAPNNALSLTAANGRLIIDNAAGTVRIYTASGALVDVIEPCGQRVEAVLPAGHTYIVRVGSQSRKIVI